MNFPVILTGSFRLLVLTCPRIDWWAWCSIMVLEDGEMGSKNIHPAGSGQEPTFPNDYFPQWPAASFACVLKCFVELGTWAEEHDPAHSRIALFGWLVRKHQVSGSLGKRPGLGLLAQSTASSLAEWEKSCFWKFPDQLSSSWSAKASL